MILVDLNLLLYAVNSDGPHHEAARTWWESALSGQRPVGLAWVVVTGFLRISTHPRVFPRPLVAEQALGMLDTWLDAPSSRLVHPSERHWGILKELIEGLGTAGNMTTDAHLAALAIEHGAELFSADHDFGRFPHLRWTNPL